jgi:hypothetical protein
MLAHEKTCIKNKMTGKERINEIMKNKKNKL